MSGDRDYRSRLPADWYLWSEYLATAIAAAQQADPRRAPKILEDALASYRVGEFPKNDPIDVEATVAGPPPVHELKVRCIRCSFGGTITDADRRLCPRCKAPLRIDTPRLPPARAGAA